MAKITTAEEALAAVRKDGKTLKDVPEKLKTTEICLEAVKQQSSYHAAYHGSVSPEDFAFTFVPENLKTPEICLIALKQRADEYMHMSVPENAKTAEVCLEMVRRNGSRLKEVPEKLRTVELCLEAVKKLSPPPSFLEPNWDRFADVPEKLREEVRRRYESGE